MKKYNIVSFLLCFSLLFSNFSVQAATITGQVLNTDIVTYINDLPIKSYNVNDKTAIIAEDLQKYGFTVNYNTDIRVLDIDYLDNNKPITANYIPEKNTKPIGSFVANVYQTDIVTNVQGEKVPSFNIGGETLIFVESLKTLGDVNWYPEERKVKFSYVPNWEYLVPYDVESDRSGNISDFNITLTKNADGKFDITGKNYEYLYNFKISGGRDKLKFGFSIYMDVSEQTSELSKLFSPMLNWDKGEFIKEDTSFANQHMKVYINGELIPITYVEGSAGNGHTDYIFTLDKEITNLNDIKTIQIECK